MGDDKKVSDYFLADITAMANDYDNAPPKHGPYYITREAWQMRSMARELRDLRNAWSSPAALRERIAELEKGD